MHALALQLAPVLAAEKSKTPFYIAGGVLVAWALLVSLVVGLNRPSFPSTLRGQRAVMTVSAVLVLATVAAAVATASPPSKENPGSAKKPSAGGESAPAPESTTPSATSTAPSATSTAPRKTAGGTTSTGASTTPSAPASRGGSSLSLEASPAGLLSYNTKTLSAKAGSVTITFANSSPLEHNMTIAQGSKVLGATSTFSGGSQKLTLALKPGKYVFYCSVPGHRQAGMEGTLNVS